MKALRPNSLKISALILWVFYAAFWVLPAIAAAPAPAVPKGFRLVESDFGVWIYKKDYQGGTPDYVQVIDLSAGAKLIAMHGDIQDPGTGKGVYGGNDARFKVQSLEKYWKDLSQRQERAFCVTNGQFFRMGETPTRLPFPLKVDGEFLTDGYGKNEFVNRKLILEIWDDKVDIHALSAGSIYASSAPTIIAGLMEEANKRSQHYVGRTFVGVDDWNHDRKYETLMIFNTRSARQVDAAGILREFGADKVMMLDGGGSTQLICRDGDFVPSDRPIPQAIGVVAGIEPPEPVYIPNLQKPAQASLIPVVNVTSKVDAINLNDAALVPVMMLPVVGVIVLVLSRFRRQYR
jgi:hypothetical protein